MNITSNTINILRTDRTNGRTSQATQSIFYPQIEPTGEPIWDRRDRMSPDFLSVATLGYAAASVCAAVLIKSLVYPSFPGNLPPFPVRPYPILGHLPYLTKGQRQKLVEWRKTLSVHFLNFQHFLIENYFFQRQHQTYEIYTVPKYHHNYL